MLTFWICLSGYRLSIRSTHFSQPIGMCEMSSCLFVFFNNIVHILHCHFTVDL